MKSYFDFAMRYVSGKYLYSLFFVVEFNGIFVVFGRIFSQSKIYYNNGYYNIYGIIALNYFIYNSFLAIKWRSYVQFLSSDVHQLNKTKVMIVFVVKVNKQVFKSNYLNIYFTLRFIIHIFFSEKYLKYILESRK